MMVLKGHLGSSSSGGGPRAMKPQPIKSWTAKSEKVYEKSRENGFVPAQRGLYTKTKNPLPVKYTVRGEWELQECEEHLTWLNKVLKKKKHKPLTDFRKSVSDGLTLVNLLEILFNEKILGIQTRPIIRAQRIENIHLCLRFLQTKGFDTRGVNAEEITDGNLRSTLALINTLKRRFESTTTSIGSQKQESAPSTPRGPVPDSISQNEERISLQGREPSIMSQISGQSETSFGRKSGDYTMNGTDSSSQGQTTTTPRVVPNGPVEPSLPGLMGSIAQEDELPTIAHNDHIVMSMTEMGDKGVLQHGAETRRTQLMDKSPRGAIRPLPVKPGDTWNPLTNPMSPLRDTLSMTVEEKLKNLLDSPTPRTLLNGQSLPQFDDGELLELPPPNFRDATDEDENGDEEANLQAMLEDPDKFDYPKDWDRYISGYVPSTTTEKKEGPRAQALLDKPPTSTTPPPDASSPSSKWNRPAPFFHGPSSHHMGTVSSTQPPKDTSSYLNGRPQPIRPISKKLPDNFRNLSGVVYGEEPIKGSQSNLSQTWSPPYRSPGDGQRARHLPTYEDHIQRHSPPVHRKLQANGQSPPTSGYESRGRSSPKTLPRSQGFQRYYPSARVQFPDQYNNTDAGFHEQYIDPMDRGQLYMSQSLPQPLDDQGSLHRLAYNRQNTAFVPIRASNPMYPMLPADAMNEEAFAMQQMGYEYNMPYSESSSRSHTPPLPPLSPDITPPETPPESPTVYKKNRSSSIWVTNNQHSPMNSRRNRGDSAGKLRKGAVNRSQSANLKLGDSRSPLRRSGSKGRRKNKHGSRNSSRASSTSGKESRKSSGSRAVPSLQLNQVQEQTEASDSDISPKQTAPSNMFMPGNDEREEEIPRGNPSRSSSSVGKENQNMEAVRSQLLALEGMYKEILTVIGSSKGESENTKTTSKITIPVSPSRTLGKPKHTKLSTKQRERDIKTVNKRFSRVESHVVTLARSVAHLSSELRSQNALIREIEALRIEVNQLKDVAYFHHDVSASSRSLHRPFVPQCANPQKIKKLTKFFGEEPPLLSIFLTDLGYEKYNSIFEKAGISMMEMPYLSEEKLENIGIPIGPRLRILQEAQIMI